jgi:uncharacterized Zn finger protein
MPSVADLVEPAMLPQRASEVDLEAGRALAERGSVTLARFGPLEVQATVRDDLDRHVVLRSKADGLAWSCDCPEGQAGMFCRHCVAAAAITWQQAPARRTRRA